MYKLPTKKFITAAAKRNVDKGKKQGLITGKERGTPDRGCRHLIAIVVWRVEPPLFPLVCIKHRKESLPKTKKREIPKRRRSRARTETLAAPDTRDTREKKKRSTDAKVSDNIWHAGQTDHAEACF